MSSRAALILVVCSATAVAVAEGVRSDAEPLVHVMQLDRATLLGMQASMLDGLKQVKITQMQYECFRKLPPSTFTEVHVRAVGSVLIADEIPIALAFAACTSSARG